MVGFWLDYWLTSLGAASVHPWVWALRHVLTGLAGFGAALVVTVVAGVLFERRLRRDGN